MKRLFTILTLFGLFLPAHAGKKEVKDSLLRIYVASPPDTTRLEVLHKLSLLEPQSLTFIYYQDKLLKEATAQKKLRYQSRAIYHHIMFYYNRLDEKHTAQWVSRLEQLAAQNNYYADYCKGKKMLIELLTINHKIELAVNQAFDMYEQAKRLNDRNGMREAYLCLLTGYFETMRYNEGLEVLEKAFELTSSDDSPLDKMTLYSKAVLVYSTLHKNEKMLLNLQRVEEATSEFLKQNNLLAHAYPELYLFIESHYALYYVRQHQPDKARPHLMKAEAYREQSSFTPYNVAYLATGAEYYRAVKEYEKALQNWDMAIKLIEPYSAKDAMTYSIQKADLLVEMGQPAEALPLYKKVIKTKDSLYNDLATSQMEEIQSLYNIDKLILQKEKRRTMYHYICLLISVIALIALIIFNIHIYRSRKRLKSDEKEMRKLAAIAEEANEIKSRFLANMSYNIRIPLNNVVGFSQLMTNEKDLSEDEKKEYSAIIQKNSNELIRLVNDVLDLSRLEANMMKFQLQDCKVREWCNDLGYMIQMREEGIISLQLHAETGEAVIHTDVNRLTQVVTNLLLPPKDSDTKREVKMEVTYQPEVRLITCRIENSPLADPRFASQKATIRQETARLFFEHFQGTFEMVKKKDGVPIIFFTYPTLTS